MTGVGIDLLEIERLERALERRPRLAERLFTDGERAYAADRGPPGQHLAARFCAKEAVAKALALEAWSWHDVEVVAASAAPGGPARAAPRRRGPTSSASTVAISLTHSRRRWPARWRWPRDAARAGSSRCPTPSAMRATDRWAIEDEGDPVARADGARGRGPGARGRRARARRRGSRSSSAARATTAATGSSPRGCCARRAATSVVLASAPRGLERGRAGAASSGCPASAPAPFDGRRASTARGDRRRAARHRLRRRAARARRPR